MNEQRNYYAEAVAIMSGVSMMQPELRHLEALKEQHQVILIRISNQLEQLKQWVLNDQ